MNDASLKRSAALRMVWKTRWPSIPFPQLDARKISSTNVLESLNREIRRRTNVVGIFPNLDSYTRLVITYLMEYAED